MAVEFDRGGLLRSQHPPPCCFGEQMFVLPPPQTNESPSGREAYPPTHAHAWLQRLTPRHYIDTPSRLSIIIVRMNRAGQFSRPVRQQIGREHLLIIIIEATTLGDPTTPLQSRHRLFIPPTPIWRWRGESHSLVKSCSDFRCGELLATRLHSTSVVFDFFQQFVSKCKAFFINADSKKASDGCDVAVD